MRIVKEDLMKIEGWSASQLEKEEVPSSEMKKTGNFPEEAE